MSNDHKILLRLTFKDEKKPYLLDISSLFYDFELLHNLCLMIYLEDYRDYKFTQYFWYRKGRLLKSEHKIRAFKIVKESPLTVELIIGGIVALSGAFWAIVQAIEKISNWKLNREKLKLEIEKLRRETNRPYYEEERARIELEHRLHEREALPTLLSLVRRLESNPINLKDIEILGEYDENSG